jgi:hypothetical protein
MCDNCIGFLSGATIVHEHACASIGERKRGRSPNAARRACDKSSFALDGIHGCRGSYLDE